MTRLAGRCECGIRLDLARGPEHGVCRGELPPDSWPEPKEEPMVFVVDRWADRRGKSRRRMEGFFMQPERTCVLKRKRADAALASVSEALDFLTA